MEENMKKKAIFILLMIFLILLIGFLLVRNYSGKEYSEENLDKDLSIEKEHVLSEYVTTKSEVLLFLERDNKMIESGIIGVGEWLHILEDKNNYYKVVNIEGEYYVKGDNLVDSGEDIRYDDRYKEYIVFNESVVTKNKTILYDDNGKLVYSFNKGMVFPIIIKDSKKYGVEFGSRLLYIKSEDVEVIEADNTDKGNTKGIGVLNYHFFYDESIVDERKDCNQVICTSKLQFKSHLDYIRDNGFMTLTMEELEWYIDGKVRLPKSVVITIDDGWRAELGIKLLTEYKFNATLFVVTNWYDPNNYLNEYIEVHSHSHNMHNVGDCNVGQGGGIQCLDEEFVLNDLKTSSDKLNGSNVFCYPFYEYNDYSIEMLKKAGYRMAFAGEVNGSDNLVKVGSDKYRLPRFVVVNYTSMTDFGNYLNGYY